MDELGDLAGVTAVGPLHQVPLTHDGDRVSSGGGLDVVGHHDHGGALLGEPAQPVQDEGGGVQIEGAGGLVGEDDPGAAGHDAGDGHALALPSGELVGLEAGAVSEPDGVKGLPGLGAVQGTPGQARGHGDVVGGTQGGNEVVLLEDEADVAGAEPGPLGGPHPGGEGAEHGHLSAGGLIEAGHAVQQRGLARPGGPDDGGEAALGQVGVDMVQGSDAGVLASGDLVDTGQAAQTDGDRRRRARPGRRSGRRQG